MRTMAEMATGLAAAISGSRVRMALILVGIVGIFGYFYVRSMSREEAR